jgi:hypothetical protein
MNPRRYSVIFLFLVAVLVSSCASNGPAAFRDSQKSAMGVRHFNVEMSQTTRIGQFTTIQSIDCDAQYFYEKALTDLSPAGIQGAGGTLAQGRPRSHKESEKVFVNGKTYGRNTSSWLAPEWGSDDAHLDWGPLSISKDPKEECGAMQVGKSFGYVNYEKFLTSGKIEYLGKQTVLGHACREYKAWFPDRTYVDTTICLGTKDDLPYRVTTEEYTATYNYDPVTRVSTENSFPLQPGTGYLQ